MLGYFPITGRLVVQDDTQIPPHVIFDTDEPFLAVKPSDVKVGSQVVPARTASSQGVDGNQVVVDIERTYYLAQIDIPGAKVVRGMMRSTWASNPEPGNDLWRQASGTHLDILDGVSQTMVPQSDLGGYNMVATMGGYTFEVDGIGNLILRERVVARARDPGSPGTTFNRARRQATIGFRLLVGFFLDQNFTPAPTAAALDGKSISSSGSMSAGYGFAGRRLVAIVHGSVPPSVTIGGVAAVKRSGNIVNGTDGRTTVWDAVVPTGETVTVSLGGVGGYVELFGVANVSGTPPTVTSNTSGASNTVSLNVDVGAGEVAIVSANTVHDKWLGDPIGFVQLANAEWKLTVSEGYTGGAGYLPENAGSVTVSGHWTGPTSGAGYTIRKAIVAIKYSA